MPEIEPVPFSSPFSSPQRELGDWDQVIGRMAEALEGQLRARAMAADIASFSRALQPIGDQGSANPEVALAG
jgi:hypothetical protein